MLDCWRKQPPPKARARPVRGKFPDMRVGPDFWRPGRLKFRFGSTATRAQQQDPARSEFQRLSSFQHVPLPPEYLSGWFVARACDFHSIGRSRVHFGGVSPGRFPLSFACWRSPRILARAKRPGGTCHRHAAANFIRRPRTAIEAFRADCLHRRHRLVPYRLELLAHHLARVAADEMITVRLVAGGAGSDEVIGRPANDLAAGEDLADPRATAPGRDVEGDAHRGGVPSLISSAAP